MGAKIILWHKVVARNEKVKTDINLNKTICHIRPGLFIKSLSYSIEINQVSS